MADPAPALAPAPAPAPPPAANWYDGKAAPEMLGFWQNKGYNAADPATVAIEATKAAMQAQTFIGAPPDQLIKLPKDATDEAGWKGVYSRLGVPAEAKDYDLSTIKTADGNDLDAGLADVMRSAFHRGNVGKDKAPEIIKAIVKYAGDRETARATEREANRTREMADFTRESGEHANYNKLLAENGVKRSGHTADQFEQAVQAWGYKEAMSHYMKIGALGEEARFVEGVKGGPITTPNSALSRKEELMADEAWKARFLKGGASEKAEMTELNRLISEAA